MTNKLVVTCPNCKKRFEYYQMKTRPFCSSICRDYDLLKWTEEEHRLPSKEGLSDADLEVVMVEMQKEEDNYDN
jgi:endogenous inhibitor of DNA gyrase (YacG/DUF329 family)